MKAETLLKMVLGATGAACALAVVPAVMPMAWLAAAHEWLGLGAMPAGPIVEYLVRSVCAFYAFLGGLMLLCVTDVRRYAPAITFTAIGGVVFSIFLLIVDHVAGLPLWWTLGEGLATLVAAVAVLVLQRRMAAEA
ncbi:hypothetical protein HQ576_00445 [bacterium]|nr:hypothetical protein [bacterium]